MTVCAHKRISEPPDPGYGVAVCRSCGHRMQAWNGEVIWPSEDMSPMQSLALQALDASNGYLERLDRHTWRIHLSNGRPVKTVADVVVRTCLARGWLAQDKRASWASYRVTRAGIVAMAKQQTDERERIKKRMVEE